MIRKPYNPNPWTARHSTPLVLIMKPLSVQHGILIVARVLNEAVIGTSFKLSAKSSAESLPVIYPQKLRLGTS